MTTASTTPPSRRRGSMGVETTQRHRGAYRRQLTATAAGAGAEARRAAAVILEVLAGLRTPAGAAGALGIRPQRYYLLEQRAVQGLVAACEPRPRGCSVSADRRLAQLERELATARRDLNRQQALARTSQRALGLIVAPGSDQTRSTTAAAKRRQRKPAVRGLRAARQLREGLPPGATAAQAVEPARNNPEAWGPAAGRSRPAGMESSRSLTESSHGGGNHGRPKAAEHP